MDKLLLHPTCYSVNVEEKSFFLQCHAIFWVVRTITNWGKNSNHLHKALNDHLLLRWHCIESRCPNATAEKLRYLRKGAVATISLSSPISHVIVCVFTRTDANVTLAWAIVCIHSQVLRWRGHRKVVATCALSVATTTTSPRSHGTPSLEYVFVRNVTTAAAQWLSARRVERDFNQRSFPWEVTRAVYTTTEPLFRLWYPTWRLALMLAKVLRYTSL